LRRVLRQRAGVNSRADPMVTFVLAYARLY
jgi:hypothetical protein